MTVRPKSAMYSWHHLSCKYPLGTSSQKAEPAYLISLHPHNPLSGLDNSFGPQHLSLGLLTALGFSFPPHFSWNAQGERGRLRPAQTPGVPTGCPGLPSYLLRSSSDLPIWGTSISSMLQIGGWRWPTGKWLQASSNPSGSLALPDCQEKSSGMF